MRLNEEISRMKSIMGLIMEQSEKKVSIQGIQPVNNTDWDLVHGILGSKRIDDDLEKRVGDELSRGDYRVISVNVKSYKSGSNIITDAEAILQPASPGQLPHKYFTTRGSIGNSFEQRHDTQVSGLEDRLKNHYKGDVKMFGPYVYSVEGTGMKYKQSFFAIEGISTNTVKTGGSSGSSGTSSEPNIQVISVVSGETDNSGNVNNNLTTFNNLIREKTHLQSLNLGSIKLDVANLTFSVEQGETKVKRLSFIFEIEDLTELNRRIQDITDKNKDQFNVTVVKSGQIGNSNNLNESFYYKLICLTPKE